jgi:hypothetical protein
MSLPRLITVSSFSVRETGKSLCHFVTVSSFQFETEVTKCMYLETQFSQTNLRSFLLQYVFHRCLYLNDAYANFKFFSNILCSMNLVYQIQHVFYSLHNSDNLHSLYFSLLYGCYMLVS